MIFWFTRLPRTIPDSLRFIKYAWPRRRSLIRELFKSANWAFLNHLQVSLMAEQVSDIAKLVEDHCRALNGQTPSDGAHIFRKPHGLKHFRSTWELSTSPIWLCKYHDWPEHSTVANFHPFLQAIVIGEDFHTRLSIGIVSRLETQASDTETAKELVESLPRWSNSEWAIVRDIQTITYTDQVPQRNISVNDDSLHLMEFSKVSCVESLDQGLVSFKA